MQFLAASECQRHVSSIVHSSRHREIQELGQSPSGRALAAATQDSEPASIPVKTWVGPTSEEKVRTGCLLFMYLHSVLPNPDYFQPSNISGDKAPG